MAPPTGGEPLQPAAVLGRHRVPRLRRTEVQVVDAVEVHVLRVPAERRLPHAEVEVRRVDALDLHAVVVVDAVEDRAEPVDVPVRLVFVGERAGRVGAVQRVVERDVLPVLPLQLLEVVVRRRPVADRRKTRTFTRIKSVHHDLDLPSLKILLSSHLFGR